MRSSRICRECDPERSKSDRPVGTPVKVRTRHFSITVLGRTLEHLGVQMYKRRDVAIAELVANCWDAGATNVDIMLPAKAGYDPTTAEIVIVDNGEGMTDDEVEEEYLVIGRNRRAEHQPEPPDRKVMGRKGIGKLAGFGLARHMAVSTWRDGAATSFELDAASLKQASGAVTDVPIEGVVGPVPADAVTPEGTSIRLSELKHKTPLDPDVLRGALARRFSRTVRGHMRIRVNGFDVADPDLNLEFREPEEGEIKIEVAPGQLVRWWAGSSVTVLGSELQGFTVLVRGKTAQAPPYFFGVESTATAQHGTKYITGVIEADFLDEGDDDESDRISTDRQEIDWADEGAAALKLWGEDLVRRLLRQRRKKREDASEKKIEDDPELRARIDALDKPSADQVRRFIRALGAADTDEDRVKPLADTVIRAYEYRQFHDFIQQLDDIAEEPEQLQLAVEYLRGWKVLESRAILEVIKGRLDIVDKFHSMIVNDAAETAWAVGGENLHDLIADYPWLIQPEWQVLSEERRITTQLRQWGNEDIADPDDRRRYDFLALESEGGLIVIEIKRSGHAVTLEDLQQLERYVERLAQGRPNIRGVFITGDRYALPERLLRNWRDREDIELLSWAEVHTRTRSYYEHYRAVLEGDPDHAQFANKEREVARTREVLSDGAYRGRERRRGGLGAQDADYETTDD